MLALGTYVVLSPFLVSIAWAIILVLVTWPIFRLLRMPMQDRPGLAAGLMTLLLALVIMLPVGFLIFAAVNELKVFVEQTTRFFTEPPQLPGWIKSIPMVGADVEKGSSTSSRTTRPEIKTCVEEQRAGIPARRARSSSGGLVEVLFKISMCLFTAFFLYRHGERSAASSARVALQVGGPRYESLLSTIRDTVRAAVYGVLLTALAQGSSPASASSQWAPRSRSCSRSRPSSRR